MHEFELIKKYFSPLALDNKSSLDLNDDVFFNKTNKLAVSVDTYVEGIHFINFKKPDLVIKKILRSSISDLICKGIYPKFYFISGSGDRKSFSKTNLKKISNSLKQEQKKYSINIGGGDTVYSRKLSFTIQLSDDKDYVGGDVEFIGTKVDTKAFRQKGVCIIYPSFLPHRVSKVTKGTRHAIVGWIHGPTFR